MYRKRTVKQIQAQRRNEIIMSLTGMLTNLRRFRDHYCRAYYLKGILNIVISATESALNRFRDLPDIVEEGNGNGNGYPTWHSMFNS